MILHYFITGFTAVATFVALLIVAVLDYEFIKSMYELIDDIKYELEIEKPNIVIVILGILSWIITMILLGMFISQ